MTRKKAQPRPDPRPQKSAVKHQHGHSGKAAPPVVSGQWLFQAICWTLAAAALCTWGVLCLLFWQGSWQLLYHPKAAITLTPAASGLAYDPVGFAATESGVLRLQGWWIPSAQSASPFARYTVLYMHGQDGNMGDTIDALVRLHDVGVNVLAFDYRGYGQSQYARPSEARWRQDADWALQYLRETRHISSGAIILDGTGLGANLALEVADNHPDLGGVMIEAPDLAPMKPIFTDPRASGIPSQLLVRDRFDLIKAAPALRIPSIWFVPVVGSSPVLPQAFMNVTALKKLVWLHSEQNPDATYAQALTQWLGGLK